MNYPNLPGGHSRRPPRKSNFFFLFILGFMAFFLFTQYKKAAVRAQAARPALPSQQDEEYDISDIRLPGSDAGGPQETPQTNPIGPDGIPIGTKPETNGDWEIDTDFATNENTQLVIGSDKGVSKTKSGDWAIEVSESKATSATKSGDKSFTQPDAKTTKKGDWEISEVEPPATISQ